MYLCIQICMYIYNIYICIYVYKYVCIYIMYIYMFLCIQICMYIYNVYIYIYVFMYTNMYVYIYIYNVYIYMYLCIQICMYIYNVYIYISIFIYIFRTTYRMEDFWLWIFLSTALIDDITRRSWSRAWPRDASWAPCPTAPSVRMDRRCPALSD